MEEDRYVPFIGDKAPEFYAITTQGEINFPQDYYGSWVVLFSYQADFTPVCTSEIMIFESMMREFKAIGTELLGLSVDSVYSHIAWLRKIKELSWKEMKHLEISFPIIADNSKEISQKYGILSRKRSDGHTIRAVFIIDPEGTIRAIQYYPTTVGRNIKEIKRLLLALQKSEQEKMVTPANWQVGDDMILATPKTYELAVKRAEQVSENIYTLDWFMSFKQSICEIAPTASESEKIPYSSMIRKPMNIHFKDKV